MSDKDETKKPFNTTFEFIGAHFDTSNIDHIVMRPAYHIIKAYRADAAWIMPHSGKLATRKKVLEVVGRAVFCAKFIWMGRAYLNSSYAAIAAAHRLTGKSDMVMITQEMTSDLTELTKLMHANAWTPLVVSPQFASPGKEGFSLDAAVRVAAPGDGNATARGGWGAHVFGLAVGQEWSSSTFRLLKQRRLSISPLELHATAAEIDILGSTGKQGGRQVVLRCDNTSACSAANTGGAYIPAMRFAPRTFLQTCVRYGITVRFWYVPSKRKIIADALSRGAWYDDKGRIEQIGLESKRVHHAKMKSLEDTLWAMNVKHRVLDYVDIAPTSHENIIKQVEAEDIGILIQ